MHRRPLSASAVVLAALAAFACSNGIPGRQTNPFGPSGGNAQTFAATVVPAVVPVSPFGGFGPSGCPANPPFTSTFSIFLGPSDRGSLSIDRVTFHFLDGSNVTSDPIAFGREDIHASAPGQFPFTVRFGCGIGHPQSLVGDLVLLDASGTRHAATVRADAR